MSNSPLFLGLMSGTSADGIDAALVKFSPECQLVFGKTYPWDHPLKQQLITLGQGQDLGLDEVGQLDILVAEAFADAALHLLQEAEIPASAITAIGSHGQTIRHRPHLTPAFTWQIGDGNTLAERTNITTVTDFRRRDMAAGGQGAPLVPAFHAALLQHPNEQRAVVNLGGIANITLLPSEGIIRGWDTGPANGLLDLWCAHHTGQAFDNHGEFAAQGNIQPDLLARFLNDPWFDLPPPKSTGREHFHWNWLQNRLQGDIAAVDIQATLLELTAITVAQAVLREQPNTERVLLCGGGVHNPVLCQRLAAHLPQCHVESTAVYGIDPDYMEAMAFAWLARQTLLQQAGNLPAVTGAKGLRVLGVVYPK